MRPAPRGSSEHDRLPDCIQLAAAIEHGCGLFLTHDAQLASLPTIAVEILT